MSKPQFQPEVQKILSPVHLRQCEVMSAWNLEAIRRRVAKHMQWIPAYAEVVDSEYRKFILLAAMDNNAVYGMSGPVDEFWHQHLVDTVDYHAMCDAVAGYFIHHIPNEPDETDQSSYQVTLRDLNHYFDKSIGIWPEAGLLRCGGKGCSSCRSELPQHRNV